ncbi:MAG: hypothetical protein ACOCSF_07610, partial [Halanaeroarchaeum sp.]
PVGKLAVQILEVLERAGETVDRTGGGQSSDDGSATGLSTFAVESDDGGDDGSDPAPGTTTGSNGNAGGNLQVGDDAGSGGTVVLLDATRSDRSYARVVNPFFRAFVTLSTPPTLQLRYDRDLAGELDRKITAARAALGDRSSAVVHEESYLGLARLTGGRVDSSSVRRDRP